MSGELDNIGEGEYWFPRRRETKMTKFHSKSDVIKLLRKRLNGHSQAELARELKVSPQHLFDVLNGTRGPGSKLVKGLKLRRVIKYEEIGK